MTAIVWVLVAVTVLASGVSVYYAIDSYRSMKREPRKRGEGERARDPPDRRPGTGHAHLARVERAQADEDLDDREA